MYAELLRLVGQLSTAANDAYLSEKTLLPEIMKAHYAKLTGNKAFPQFAVNMYMVTLARFISGAREQTDTQELATERDCSAPWRRPL